MRSQDHLFVLISDLQMKEKSDDGNILTVEDLQKFFDKENLIDTMVSLSEAKTDQKCYMFWYKHNERVVLTIRTGAGVTEVQEIFDVVGQGTGGASLASSLNIDIGVKSYFHDSIEETFYGRIRLQPLIFCDDLNRLANIVRKIRSWLIKLDFVMKEKHLIFHPEKCIYLPSIGRRLSRSWSRIPSCWAMSPSRRSRNRSTWGTSFMKME